VGTLMRRMGIQALYRKPNTSKRHPVFPYLLRGLAIERANQAHGFLRLRCGDCGHDKLVAFSCKRRGFCPSCGARRMAQTAAHLVDHVIPHVPVRQWVLSLPIPLRLLLAAQPELVTPVLQVVHRVISRRLLDQAGLKADEADSGAVTLIQRFGSAANLNIHLHCLVLDGVYRRGTDGAPEFVEVRADQLGAVNVADLS
jgi:ribosomal protein S27E